MRRCPTTPHDAPLSSYRIGRDVKVLKYGQALQAFREIVKKSGRDPKDFVALAEDWGGFHPCGRGGFRESNPEGREVEVRFLQTVYSK